MDIGKQFLESSTIHGINYLSTAKVRITDCSSKKSVIIAETILKTLWRGRKQIKLPKQGVFSELLKSDQKTLQPIQIIFF